MTDKLQACLEKIPNVTSLKPEQTQAVEALLAGKDVLAILPTGFGKRLIYHVFSMAQTYANASVLVITPLNSIVEEQAKEMNGLGMRSVHLKPDIGDCLHVIFFSPRRVSPFSRGVIFTHALVSLALISLRTNGGLLVVYD